MTDKTSDMEMSVPDSHAPATPQTTEWVSPSIERIDLRTVTLAMGNGFDDGGIFMSS